MSVFTTPDAVPARLAGVRRMAGISKGGLDRAELQASLQPDETGESAKGDSMVGRCVREALSMGVLSSSQEQAYLAGRPVAEALNDPHNKDLVRAIAFILETPPVFDSSLYAKWFEPNPSLQNALSIGSSTRTPVLEHWAVHFGFGRRLALAGRTAFVPDLTGYLETQIDSLFEHFGDTFSLTDGHAELARRCPVWDGSPARREIAQQFPTVLSPRSETELAFAESMAWFRLDGRGKIRLLYRQDGVRFKLSAFDRVEQFTHVGRGLK